eukprot:459165-Rhodomonas_salina.1
MLSGRRKGFPWKGGEGSRGCREGVGRGEALGRAGGGGGREAKSGKARHRGCCWDRRLTGQRGMGDGYQSARREVNRHLRPSGAGRVRGKWCRGLCGGGGLMGACG